MGRNISALTQRGYDNVSKNYVTIVRDSDITKDPAATCYEVWNVKENKE